MNGFQDQETGAARRGFIEIIRELEERFPTPDDIVKEAEKKEFAKLFGEYQRVENVLRNYDEFTALKALQGIDIEDEEAAKEFREAHHLTSDDLKALKPIELPSDRKVQNYRSSYNDIRDWLRREKASDEKEKSIVNWDDIVFEIDLLKSQEINLDYILELIFEKARKTHDKDDIIVDARRVIRASLGNRAKESLLVDFINQTDLSQLKEKAGIIDAFYAFARAEQAREVEVLIKSEGLNSNAAKCFIATSVKREFASENGADLNAILTKMCSLNPQFRIKKQTVFQKISSFVEKFKGVVGEI